MFVTPVDPTLKQFIISYWFIQADQIPAHTKMLPDGYSDIMLNLGSGYTLIRPGEETAVIDGSALFGQRTGYLLLDQPGPVNMVGIRLRPGSEHHFTGKNASELCNTYLLLREVVGNPIIERTEKALLSVASHDEKTGIVESLLLDMLKANKAKTNEKIFAATGMIIRQKGNIVLEEVLQQTGLSYKQCERLFQKHLGLPPKMYLRIIRFHHAFTQVRSVQKADWMSVLVACGYYDQSHFIKDFKFFSGQPPARLLSEKDTLDEVFGFG